MSTDRQCVLKQVNLAITMPAETVQKRQINFWA
jgi:hypothetical protein